MALLLLEEQLIPESCMRNDAEQDNIKGGETNWASSALLSSGVRAGQGRRDRPGESEPF